VELRERLLRAAAVTVDHPGERKPVARPVRNGLPVVPPYRYRAPRPAWAVRAVAASIAEHGEPPLRRLRDGGYTWEPSS